MAFNLGLAGLKKFPTMLHAVDSGDWATAAAQCHRMGIGDARNQYTLGYTPKAGIGGYRQIEVRVRRPDVKVYAKDGYYPLPTPRQR